MRTLYVKFTVITISIMFLSTIFAFFIANAYYQINLKDYNDEKNTAFAHSITEFIESSDKIDLRGYLNTIATIGYQIYLIDEAGEETYFGNPYRVVNLEESTEASVLAGHTYHGIMEYPSSIFVTGFFANELKNTIGTPFEYNDKKYGLFLRPDIKLLFNEARYLLTFTILFGIVISIVFIAFSMAYLVKPVAKLTQATKSLADGDYEVGLYTNRRDELGELSRSFSRMAKQLERVDDVRKEFISNISHDIQSPLSNINGYANLLKIDELKPEERDQYVGVIQDESRRLSALTKQLLMLTSLDHTDDLMNKKTFNLASQLKELIRNYSWQAGEKGIMMSYELPDTEINGDPSLLNAVWDNLLMNAIKYNRENGLIEVVIQNNGDAILVMFRDSGVGLKEDEIERVFDRFYRADTARSRTIEGTGLGLSIVNTIVKLHGGKIKVISVENKGSTFIVELPVE